MVSPRAQNILTLGSATVGVIVVVLAVVLGWVVVPKIIENKVEHEVRLEIDSDTYKKWQDIPMPIKFKVYFFNVTNVEAFNIREGLDADWGITPIFEEVGPFVYDEYHVKHNVVMNETEDTLYYDQRITYVFNKEESGPGLTEDTKLNLLNLPLITVMTIVDIQRNHMPVWLSAIALNALLSHGETIIQKDVKPSDYLFRGHHLHGIYKLVETVARLSKITLPDEISNGVFALYREKNNTYGEGRWSVHTGISDSSKFNIINTISRKNLVTFEWEETKTLEPWWRDHCARISGTDGTMFPPFIKRSTRLYVYAPEICRSVYLEYDSDVKYEGIKGYRFKVPQKMFQNPYDNPDNMCYCMDVQPPLNNSCNFNGMTRIFSCKADVPIIIGKPHFLDADDWVQEKGYESGLRPNREIHDPYVDVEPNTGFPLRVSMRIQIGVEAQPLRTPGLAHLAPFDTIPHMFYPICWVDKNAALNEELVDEIKSKLVTPLKIVTIGKWTAIGVGAALVVCGLIAFMLLRKKRLASSESMQVIPSDKGVSTIAS